MPQEDARQGIYLLGLVVLRVVLEILMPVNN
jgi:hypothetical protein